MLFDILKSKRGSTLLVVLLALMVLSILGTTILSLSVTNFKMKMVDRNAKKTFYLAEAGLEEAYAEIGKVIHQGIQSGNSFVEVKLENFIEEAREVEMLDPDSDDSDYIEGTDGTGPVDEEEIKVIMNEWFQEGYKDYIDDHLFNTLDNKIYGTLDTGNYADVNIEDVDQFNGGTEYAITLSSQFDYQGITKKLRAIFHVKIPEYNAPYYVVNDWKTIHENVLFMKALTTEKDMIVQDGPVTINGNIYAYGTQPVNKKLSTEFGGVVVGKDSNSGDLTVNGNVYTNSFLHTNANDSSIEIGDGDVFCNSLVVQQDKTNSHITVNNGVVNTWDDVELNGKNSTITINGSYYGFSYGADGHDVSSSIVVNSDDIGINSYLEITGESVPNHQPSSLHHLFDYSSYQSGTFLGGTVYIDTDDDTSYQTGESVSIQGNYRAYMYYFDRNDLLSVTNSEEADKYKKENIIMGDYAPLVLADQFLNGESLSDEHRSRYFELYHALHTINPSVYDYPLSFGNTSGIKLDNMMYSLGIWISDNSLKSRQAIIDYVGILDEKKIEYLLHINRMGDPSRDNVNTRSYIEDWFTYGDPMVNTDLDEKDEIVFINKDASKTLVIQGSGSTETGDYTIDGSDAMKGIVITRGDVILSGGIDFSGTIIAKGNIWFKGNGTKNLTNNEQIQENFIFPKIVETEELSGFTDSGPAHKYLYETDADVETIGSYIKFGDLVDITWERLQ